jgi:hypothetical protein
MQGIVLARQVLYHSSHSVSSFLFVIFVIGSHFLDLNSPICASHIAGMADMHHHAQSLFDMAGGSQKLFAYVGHLWQSSYGSMITSLHNHPQHVKQLSKRCLYILTSLNLFP